MNGRRGEPAGGLVVESVDALSPDEALLLARELPHLGRLIAGTLPGVDRDVSRRLALGVLNVAQGHPKLLELADGQAADPERLAALVAAGDQAWRESGGLPGGFFTSGDADGHGDRPGDTPARLAGDYLHVLAAWTTEAAGTLDPGERALFWLVCCLEEPDREQAVLYANWADLWGRLGLVGAPPAPGQALSGVAACGLVTVHGTAPDGYEYYAVHPGVAAAGREQAGQAFRDATDTETAAYWDAWFRYASGENADGTVDTGLLVRAGLAAVPYLSRQEQWDHTAYLLESAFAAEPTRANAAAALPVLQQATARNPRHAVVAAMILRVIDTAAAEAQVRAYLSTATADGDYKGASMAAGRLITLCQASGRLAEALDLAGQKAGYIRKAGLGPWTQLVAEVQRLQVLNAMGQAAPVLAEVQRLRDQLTTLPPIPGTGEAVNPWDIREALLGTGREAAVRLGRWEEALTLNAVLITSMGDRRAPGTEIAGARFSDYFPLLSLGRTTQALNLLLDCRKTFQDANDTWMLGQIFGALAHTEDERGHGDAAIRLQYDALRYSYLAADVTAIAASYHNLGDYLHARQPARGLACHLTAALIYTLTSAEGSDESVSNAAADLRALGTAATPPADIAILCQQFGDIPGTDPHRLLTALASDSATAEYALQQLIAQAQTEAAVPPPGE